jgi:hypothetical protein
MNRSVIYIFLILMITFSCNEKLIIVNCPDCLPEEPTTGNITIKLEGISEYGADIRIYEGNLEDNVLLATFRSNWTSTEYEVKLNRKYTISAEYHDSRGNTYIAVDSVFPRVKYDREQCDDPCYFIYNKTVNLRIKYPKLD